MHARHADIHADDLRSRAAGLFHHLQAIAHLPSHFEVRLQIQQMAQSLTEQLVIIGQENPCFHGYRRGLARASDFNTDARPLAGSTLQAEPPTRKLSGFAHVDEAQTCSASLAHDLLHIKPYPIVSDANPQQPILQLQLHGDAPGMGVLGCVGQRFLDDTEQRQFQVRSQAHFCMLSTCTCTPVRRANGSA